MIYETMLFKPFATRKHDAEGGYWPCDCPRCRAKDLADFEQRRRKGLVE